MLDILQDLHFGDTVVVIGGNGKAAEEFLLVDSKRIVIGCNHHWVGICNPDYMVSLDRPAYNINLRNAYSKINGVTIGRYEFSNHPTYMVNNRFLTEKGIMDTGGFGIWLAEHIGAGKIIKCGFDEVA